MINLIDIGVFSVSGRIISLKEMILGIATHSEKGTEQRAVI